MSDHELIREALKLFGNKEASLLKILQWVNQERGHVSKQNMIDIAFSLNMASSKVFSVATFYHYIHNTPMGKYTIYLCQTISCHMKNRKDVVEAVRDFLKIDFGQTTEDKLFSLVEVNCLGQCDRSPAMMINDFPFGRLTPEKVIGILQDYKSNSGINVRQAEVQHE